MPERFGVAKTEIVPQGTPSLVGEREQLVERQWLEIRRAQDMTDMKLPLREVSLEREIGNVHGVRQLGCSMPRTTRTVSRAMSNSSSVGITQTSMREPDASIRPSLPFTIAAFRSSSIVTPIHWSPLQIRERTALAFSPMPPAKITASAPFIAAR